MKFEDVYPAVTEATDADAGSGEDAEEATAPRDPEPAGDEASDGTSVE